MISKYKKLDNSSPQCPIPLAFAFARRASKRASRRWRLAKSLDISQSAVAQWESGRSFPAPAMASRLQKLLGISPPAATDEERVLTRRAFDRRPRLPVVGSPAPGDEERILIDAIPRGEVLAPPQLEGVQGAKAVYVRGRAMEPRYYAGEIVYLHPTRPPNPGDFVFLTVREPSFPAGVGYIRQFAGADLGKYPCLHDKSQARGAHSPPSRDRNRYNCRFRTVLTCLYL